MKKLLLVKWLIRLFRRQIKIGSLCRAFFQKKIIEHYNDLKADKHEKYDHFRFEIHYKFNNNQELESNGELLTGVAKEKLYFDWIVTF